MMFYIVLFVHWIADFVCQTRKMASNKSTSMNWLLSHIMVYTLVMSCFGWKFGLFNGLTHLMIDYVTSRGTSYFWKLGNVHAFFCVVGLDQFLHVAILYATLDLI